jgi:hypothetical protein
VQGERQQKNCAGRESFTSAMIPRNKSADFVSNKICV